ncbi:amino acid ABC transporter permease [Desulfovibrio litoralis]|uniref:amino acid ABC transporter permease n=1 Tax=Desulfovibrio litoralis TaxID=466107 RepID=UPI0015BBA421|nr:amino acid ABC transporter permease [Desulfovibrio litoralis]
MTSWLWNWFTLELPEYLLIKQADGTFKLGVLGVGLFNTLKVSFFASFLAFLVGALITFGRFSGLKFLVMYLNSYVSLVRNLPPLVFLLVLHFFFSIHFLPSLSEFKVLSWLNLEHTQNLNFISAVLALSLYEAAYISEILRGAMSAVSPGQWQGAYSLGLGRFTCLRKIILPQAFRYSLPSLSGQLISLVKDSSILSIISIQELSFQATERMASSHKVSELWLGVAFLYLIVNLTLSFISKRLERSFKWQI